MQSKNNNYYMLVSNKAINLIMLGDQKQANDLLTKLYASETDEALKEIIAPLMNKTKKELIELFTSDQINEANVEGHIKQD